MQVFKYYNERLIEALAQQQALDGVKRALTANLRVHLLQRRSWFSQPQQEEQIRQNIFQTAVECEHPPGDLLPSLSFVIVHTELKILLQQIDEWQIRIGFPVGDGESFQHKERRTAIQPDEFIKEPRLAHPRFTHHADDLTMSGSGLFQCAL